MSGGAIPARSCVASYRAPAGVAASFGSTTVSITWITPLLAATSALTTVASSTSTRLSRTRIVNAGPSAVAGFAPPAATISFDPIRPGTTWYFRMAVY